MAPIPGKGAEEAWREGLAAAARQPAGFLLSFPWRRWSGGSDGSGFADGCFRATGRKRLVIGAWMDVQVIQR